MLTVAIEITTHAVFTVSRLADSVAANRTDSTKAIIRAIVAIFAGLAGAVVVTGAALTIAVLTVSEAVAIVVDAVSARNLRILRRVADAGIRNDIDSRCDLATGNGNGDCTRITTLRPGLGDTVPPLLREAGFRV